MGPVWFSRIRKFKTVRSDVQNRQSLLEPLILVSYPYGTDSCSATSTCQCVPFEDRLARGSGDRNCFD
eukprot:scaffold476113_cov18-Prasinocladus_malaysianus.AAC.1